ncbi:hypothetical protein WH47_06157 [Habropoda laboriosa]|uniref:Uncharacterized protein n=1 Tax=Habropoda laboriosa TaxID=597456 RepID=A0A0L7QTC5_9HYME|nr:hypothetical protein WH47_06157 [Habropoda laboriosa]
MEDMKKVAWATFYRMSSTNDNLLHYNCPEGEGSWCKWRRAEAKGELESFSHPPPLNDEVLEAIRPVFENLTSDDLLERCIGGNTQNNNEYFNSCVWTLAPKYVHCGANTIEIAAFLAACTFNNGYLPLAKVMS